jgi:hypothetical protein
MVLLSVTMALLGGAFAQTLVLTNGDVNGDNAVDDSDLLAVLFAFGQSCPSGCPEDLNGDGVLDDADMLIVQFNAGQQGAPAFAGTVQSPSGNFSRSLTLRLGDWGGAARTVKVQLKPVGSENDASVPIYEWSVTVGGTDTQVQLTNLPAGVYTVRAFPATAGRWLRTEGILLTEVPWIFAVPTGANKVTVYWDPVPGATGYRVRWGTASGSYLNMRTVSALPPYRVNIEGLTSGQMYYFVVEAAYNGVWGPPSEEDSATPHAGAIPWDRVDDPAMVLTHVRQLIDNETGVWLSYGSLTLLAPDGGYYSEDEYGNAYYSPEPMAYYDPGDSVIRTSGGAEVPFPAEGRRLTQCENAKTGPYRRVTTKRDIRAQGTRAMFYLPPVQYGVTRYININVNNDERTTVNDVPYIYFGLDEFRNNRLVRLVEAGIAFFPSESYNVDYARWTPFLRTDKFHTLSPVVFPFFGAQFVRRQHFGYVNGYGYYGFYVEMVMQADLQKRSVSLLVLPYDPVLDVGLSPVGFFGAVPVQSSGQTFVKRVHAIAQKLSGQDESRGYRHTNAWILQVGVGYDPLIFGEDIQPGAQVWYNNAWRDWTAAITDQNCIFPIVNPPIIQVQQRSPFSREVISINLRR